MFRASQFTVIYSVLKLFTGQVLGLFLFEKLFFLLITEMLSFTFVLKGLHKTNKIKNKKNVSLIFTFFLENGK